MCSCGGVTKPWGGEGQLLRGSFHTPFHLLFTTAGDRLMQLSIQFIAAFATTLCHKPFRSAITNQETTNAPSAWSKVYSHTRANPSSTTANGGQSLGSVLGDWIACPNMPERHCIHNQKKRKNVFLPPQWSNPLTHKSLCRDPGSQPFHFPFRTFIGVRGY